MTITALSLSWCYTELGQGGLQFTVITITPLSLSWCYTELGQGRAAGLGDDHRNGDISSSDLRSVWIEKCVCRDGSASSRPAGFAQVRRVCGFHFRSYMHIGLWCFLIRGCAVWTFRSADGENAALCPWVWFRYPHRYGTDGMLFVRPLDSRSVLGLCATARQVSAAENSENPKP